MSRDEQSQEIWKGAVAGLVGGLAGAWAMNQFQVAWAKLEDRSKAEHRDQHKQQLETDEDATMRMADRLLRPVLGRELTRREKKIGGPIVHYTFGGSMGALYGIAAEFSPLVRWGAGTGFGSVLFVGADEIAVPLSGLSGSPTQTPLKLHVYAWASHIVYGFTAEMTRLGVRAALGNETVAREPVAGRSTRLREHGDKRRTSRLRERRAA